MTERMLRNALFFTCGLILLTSPRASAYPSMMVGQCSRSLEVGATIMGKPVKSIASAPDGQQHGIQVLKNGVALACGATLQQDDTTITVKVGQALLNKVKAPGWSEYSGPAYILETTNGELESTTGQTGCSNSRLINSEGEISVKDLKPGDLTIRILSAYKRGTVYSDECSLTVLDGAAPVPAQPSPGAPAPPPPPPPPPSDATCIPGSGLCLTSSGVDAGQLTTTITSDSDSWFSIGFSTPGGGMTANGAGADIFVCSGEGLRRFWVTQKANPELGPTQVMSQNGESAVCELSDGRGRMTFTRPLAAGANERAIVQGVPQAIIWAVGAGEQELRNYHGKRGEVSLDLTTIGGEVAAVAAAGSTSLWLHMLCMASAWSLLLPMGAAIANRTRMVAGAPAGAWFKLHRRLQVVGWCLQVLGFICIYSHVGSSSLHWQHPHSVVGLLCVLAATLQPLNAYFRPHPPATGWRNGEKPAGRLAFEFVHKGLGWAAVGLGMVNVLVGAMLARQLGFTSGLWGLPLFVGCVGIVMFVLYLAMGFAAPNNALNRRLTGARLGEQYEMRKYREGEGESEDADSV